MQKNPPDKYVTTKRNRHFRLMCFSSSRKMHAYGHLMQSTRLKIKTPFKTQAKRNQGLDIPCKTRAKRYQCLKSPCKKHAKRYLSLNIPHKTQTICTSKLLFYQSIHVLTSKVAVQHGHDFTCQISHLKTMYLRDEIVNVLLCAYKR